MIRARMLGKNRRGIGGPPSHRTLKVAGALAAWSLLGAAPPTEPAAVIHVPHPPAIDWIGGGKVLRYELAITNRSGDALRLDRLQTVDPSNGRVIADLRGGALHARAPATLSGEAPGIAYLDLVLGAAAAPKRISSRLTYRTADGSVREAAATAIVDSRHPVVIGPPLGAGLWVAVHNDEWARGHRRALYPLDGKRLIPGRFAIDWVGIDQQGRTTKGNPDRVADTIGYAAPVLAAADARVVAARDGAAEATTIADNPKYIAGEAAGSHVVLDLGDRRYAFYEHLRPGSIKVSVGDRVRRGQVIGELGFTGQSTGPHLHFHVANDPRPLGGNGLPFVIDRFFQCGRYDDFGNLGKAKWREAPTARITRERPGGGAVVVFTGAAGCKAGS